MTDPLLIFIDAADDAAAYPLSRLYGMTVAADATVLMKFESSIGSGGTDGSAADIITLTCTSGKEIDVVKDLTALACSTASYENPVVVFDAINSVYPINHITGIQIRRHATTVTVASD